MALAGEAPGYVRRLLAATTRTPHHDLSRPMTLVEPLSDRVWELHPTVTAYDQLPRLPSRTAEGNRH